MSIYRESQYISTASFQSFYRQFESHHLIHSFSLIVCSYIRRERVCVRFYFSVVGCFFLVEVRVPPCMRVDAIDVTAVCVTLEHVESAENLSFSSK